MDRSGRNLGWLQPLFSVFPVRCFDVVDHDVERRICSFVDRRVALGHKQMGAAAQFQHAVFLVAENMTQSERTEEIDGLDNNMGVDLYMPDGDHSERNAQSETCSQGRPSGRHRYVSLHSGTDANLAYLAI
jgi:hypothetical protein